MVGVTRFVVLCIAVLGVSVGLVWWLTPLAIRLAERHGLVALPGPRRKHKGAIPRIGGLPLFPAFAAAALLSLLVPTSDPLEGTRLAGVLLGLAIVWVMGFLDDAYNLSSWVQFVGLLSASTVAMAFKVFIEVFNSPFTGEQVWVEWYLMVPITLVWLAGMSSTVNFLDGLDGLAAGVTAIAALVLFVHMVRLDQLSVSLLPLALAGCAAGFLRFNFGRARIFLGGGAYLLGFALGALSIVAGAKVATALLVVWLPLVDALWQVYARWRRGQRPNLGDRGHLHMRLADLGWPQRRIVLMYYGVTAILGAAALLVSSRLLKLGILAGVGLIVVAGLAALTRRTGDRTPTGR